MRYARLLLIFLVLVSGFLLAGRPSNLRIPIVGELAGQRINTVVDSELAKYYLENYLANKRMNPELDALYIIFFIPGWVYKSHPETGADLAKPREIIAKR